MEGSRSVCLIIVHCTSQGLVGHFTQDCSDLYESVQSLLVGYFPIDFRVNPKGGCAILVQQ